MSALIEDGQFSDAEEDKTYVVNTIYQNLLVI